MGSDSASLYMLIVGVIHITKTLTLLTWPEQKGGADGVFHTLNCLHIKYRAIIMNPRRRRSEVTEVAYKKSLFSLVLRMKQTREEKRNMAEGVVGAYKGDGERDPELWRRLKSLA